MLTATSVFDWRCYVILQTVTMYIVVFYVWTQMFQLISSFAFQYLLCFVHGQGQRTKELQRGQKTFYKETV